MNYFISNMERIFLKKLFLPDRRNHFFLTASVVPDLPNWNGIFEQLIFFEFTIKSYVLK